MNPEDVLDDPEAAPPEKDPEDEARLDRIEDENDAATQEEGR